MGCCESKLLEIAPTPVDNQANNIQDEQCYLPTHLANIQPEVRVKNRYYQNQQCSLKGLQINLGSVINEFEQKLGRITYTCLMSSQNKTVRSKKTGRSNKNQINSCRMTVQQDEFVSNFSSTMRSQHTKLKTHAYGLSSNCAINPGQIQILDNLTIRAEDVLQKQLYYTQYAQINGITLYEWQQANRLSLQYNELQLFQTINDCDTFTAGVIFNIFAANLRNSIRLVSYSLKEDGPIFSHHPFGIKVYLNGFKRLLPVQIREQTGNRPFNMSKHIQQFCDILLRSEQKQTKIEQCYFIYYLTGWIPEIINLSQVQPSYHIFEKLSSTIQAFNAIILFVKQSNGETYILNKVNIQTKEVQVYSVEQLRFCKCIDLCIKSIKWQDIMSQSKKFTINWNPQLYEFQYKFQTQITTTPNRNIQYDYQQFPQFLLTIPPIQDQLQIRVFVQRHLTIYNDDQQYALQLYQYIGQRKQAFANNPVKRVVSYSSRLLTQIFIFEASQIQNRYIFVIKPIGKEQRSQINTDIQKNEQFSMTLYGFKQILMRKLRPQTISVEQSISSVIYQDEVGYSLISPYFINNPHYYLEIPKCQVLRISVQTNYSSIKQKIIYQILLIKNSQGLKQAATLNPDSLVSADIISQVYQTNGELIVQPRAAKFMLFIVCYKVIGPINLTVSVQCVDIHHKYIPRLMLQQNLVSFQKIQQKSCILQQKKFRWTTKNPGARQRKVSNTSSQFYEEGMFKQFFENPNFDYALDAGLYQFNIRSQSFEASFKQQNNRTKCDSVHYYQSYQDIIQSKPPNVSIGIFQIVRNQKNKQFRIIKDDQFYVPFGFGYWTKQIYLSKGQYRFVMSKLQKRSENGVFTICKIK